MNGPMIGLGCPDCGKVTPETLLAGTSGHCGPCGLRFRLDRAQLRPPDPREEYCAACDRTIQRGHWPKHVFSREHRTTVRLHLVREVCHA